MMSHSQVPAVFCIPADWHPASLPATMTLSTVVGQGTFRDLFLFDFVKSVTELLDQFGPN
jgi:hypothetical protein